MKRTAKPALSLKGRALQWLAQREHSRAEMRRKLLAQARMRAMRADGQLRLAAELQVEALAAPRREISPAPQPDLLRGPAGGPAARRGARDSGGDDNFELGADAEADSGTDADADANADADADADTAPAALLAEVEAVLDWLDAHGYLCEERFVEARVHTRAARFGNLRIRQELAQHGLELPADAAQTLQATELERARAVWARKFAAAPLSAAERARQQRFLAGRGFSAEVIHQVLRAPIRAEDADGEANAPRS